MKRKHTVVRISIVIVLLVCSILGANALLTGLIESTNVECKDQSFSTPQEALAAMEANARNNNDVSLDYCPPYEMLYTFDCEKNTIIFYSYCESFDGEQSASYAVRILKHNEDGTLSFSGGSAEFKLSEPKENEPYYYFTNIKTTKGNKSISFLYLPKDSEKDVFVDGVKADKILVSINDQDFYICYALSDRDTFLSNLFTPISQRHKIELK